VKKRPKLRHPMKAAGDYLRKIGAWQHYKDRQKELRAGGMKARDARERAFADVTGGLRLLGRKWRVELAPGDTPVVPEDGESPASVESGTPSGPERDAAPEDAPQPVEAGGTSAEQAFKDAAPTEADCRWAFQHAFDMNIQEGADWEAVGAPSSGALSLIFASRKHPSTMKMVFEKITPASFVAEEDDAQSVDLTGIRELLTREFGAYWRVLDQPLPKSRGAAQVH